MTGSASSDQGREATVGSGSSPQNGVSRRTLVTAAAWSIPVIATAVSAPLAAASVVDCPDISQPDVWGPFELVSGTSGGRQENVLAPNIFEFWSENGDTATESAVIRKSTTMSVVAGTTYTFTFQAGMNYGLWDSTQSVPSAINLTVNGQQIWYAQSREGTLPVWSGDPAPRVYETFTATFTAPTTGTIPVDINFVMGTKPDPALANDDIRISTPTIACS